MAKTVIDVSGLSKRYDLGLIGTGTLSKDLNRFWAKLRGKPDPYATIAELNDRTKKSNTGVVSALKEINFSVKEGEVLGIIGKNGAGKSTLLKILSQITSPSSGEIKIKGRVASLLEVGTGMHPEMTARQNVFLNGSILGMTRSEINQKLDEIIEFAGIEKYIDTPIKRFSSGMKVRLGFAVAAFLEPEILIVDEVLAVGDAEFQKQAIGKMKEVSRGGKRTVLFVSHNMASVKSLCDRGILLEKGEISHEGPIDDLVDQYLLGGSVGVKNNERTFNTEEQSGMLFPLEKIRVVNKSGGSKITVQEDSFLEIIHTDKTTDVRIDFTCRFKSKNGVHLFNCSTEFLESGVANQEKNMVSFTLPSYFFNVGVFFIDILVVERQRTVIQMFEQCIQLDIVPGTRGFGRYTGKSKAPLRPRFKTELNSI